MAQAFGSFLGKKGESRRKNVLLPRYLHAYIPTYNCLTLIRPRSRSRGRPHPAACIPRAMNLHHRHSPTRLSSTPYQKSHVKTSIRLDISNPELMSSRDVARKLRQSTWNGSLPLEIRLHKGDCRTYDKSDAYLVTLTISILHRLSPRAGTNFSGIVPDDRVCICVCVCVC